MKLEPIPQQWIEPRKLKNSQTLDYICTVQKTGRLIYISPASPVKTCATHRLPSSSSATHRLPSFRRTSTPASVVRFLPPLPFSRSSSLPLRRAPPASSLMPRPPPARRDARAAPEHIASRARAGRSADALSLLARATPPTRPNPRAELLRLLLPPGQAHEGARGALPARRDARAPPKPKQTFPPSTPDLPADPPAPPAAPRKRGLI
jgi:hypothetical protein